MRVHRDGAAPTPVWLRHLKHLPRLKSPGSSGWPRTPPQPGLLGFEERRSVRGVSSAAGPARLLPAMSS